MEKIFHILLECATLEKDPSEERTHFGKWDMRLLVARAAAGLGSGRGAGGESGGGGTGRWSAVGGSAPTVEPAARLAEATLDGCPHSCLSLRRLPKAWACAPSSVLSLYTLHSPACGKYLVKPARQPLSGRPGGATNDLSCKRDSGALSGLTHTRYLKRRWPSPLELRILQCL